MILARQHFRLHHLKKASFQSIAEPSGNAGWRALVALSLVFFLICLTEEERPLDALGIYSHSFKPRCAHLTLGCFRFKSLGFLLVKVRCGLVIVWASIGGQTIFKFKRQYPVTGTGTAYRQKAQHHYQSDGTSQHSPFANDV
jgi:hypothetical protein